MFIQYQQDSKLIQMCIKLNMNNKINLPTIVMNDYRLIGLQLLPVLQIQNVLQES